MIELAVAILTALPICRAAWCGHRIGARRMARWACGAAPPWAATLAITGAGYALGWYWPLGLITPLIAGLVAAAVVRLALRRRRARRSPSAPVPSGAGDRAAGLLVGAGTGTLVTAMVWILVLLIGGVTATHPRTAGPATTNGKSSEWLSQLADTAHRGFVRHLPVVGPLADEVEALIFVLNAGPDDQRRIARLRSWGQLAELPAMRATLADAEVMAEIDELRTGDLLALYRLQRDPKVLSLLSDRAVRDAACGLRPTTIARELGRGDYGPPGDGVAGGGANSASVRSHR